jgi:hypothetical protein
MVTIKHFFLITGFLSVSIFGNSFVFGQCGSLIDVFNIRVFSNHDLGLDSTFCNKGVILDEIGESLSVLPSNYIQFQRNLYPNRIFADYLYLDTLIKVFDRDVCFDLKIIVIDSLEKSGRWILTDQNNKVRSEYQYTKGGCLIMLFYNENGELIRQVCFIDKENIVDSWFYKSKLIRLSFPLNDGFVLKEFCFDGSPFLEYYYNNSGKFFEGYKYSKSGDVTFVKSSNRGRIKE